ncbi:MAG: ATP-binding protein [Lysobacter sp.]
MRLSLASRIVLWCLGSLLFLFAFSFGVMLYQEQGGAAARTAEMLEEEAELLAISLQLDEAGQLAGLTVEPMPEFVFDSLPSDAAYRVLDQQGSTILQSRSGPAIGMLNRIPFEQVQSSVGTTSGTPALRVHTTRVTHGDRSYYLQVANSDRLVALNERHEGRIAMRVILVAFLLAVLVFGIVLALTVRRVVVPLRKVSTIAASITPGNLTERIPASGLPTELVPLIDGFNGALERLETGFRVQQEFLAASAHELKTPLALLRAEIEIHDRPEDQVLLDGIDFMSRQVHQLLHLAEVRETQNYAFEELDAGREVQVVLAYLDPLARGRNVLLSQTLDSAPAVLRADRGAFFVLVKNLVENAILHAPPESVVRVRLSSGAMAIHDAGPGIPGADMENIFQRFWRGPGRVTQGAGLGLPICAEIACAHGWTIQVRNNGDMPGATFEVVFDAGNSAPGPDVIWRREGDSNPRSAV